MSGDRPIWYSRVPPGFFSQSANRRAFMDWLEQKLEIREPEDWYVLTPKLIRDLGGEGVLKWYGNSMVAMLEDYTPPYDWKDWLFPRVPRGFWQQPENCRNYLEWLGEQLGFVEPEDWYQLKGDDLAANRGVTLMRPFGECPCRIVMTFFPEYEWLEWRFVYAPIHFWDEPRNQRRYLDWLGKELGYEGPEDWYRLRGDDIVVNYGCTLLNRFGQNPCHVVMANFPDHEWLEWKFVQVPRFFWEDAANCRRYLDWLGRRLGIENSEGWYSVTKEDFASNFGGTLLGRHDGSVCVTVMTYFPEHGLKEWHFRYVPKHFWDDPANCDRYLDWLGSELGFQEPRDWYRLSLDDLENNCGLTMAKRFGCTILEIVRFHIPELEWLEWLFLRVPVGFWEDTENRRRYMVWLGEQLGFEEPEDWYQLRKQHFSAHRGATLLQKFGSSPCAALRDFMPQYDWKEWLFAQCPKGFWTKRVNRQRYMKWLGEKLGFEKPEDWSDVRLEDFTRNHGATLLELFSLDDVLRDNSVPGRLGERIGPD